MWLASMPPVSSVQKIEDLARLDRDLRAEPIGKQQAYQLRLAVLNSRHLARAAQQLAWLKRKTKPR